MSYKVQTTKVAYIPYPSKFSAKTFVITAKFRKFTSRTYINATMKRHLFLLVALLPLVVSAYDAQIDGIYYNFSEDEASVTYRTYYDNMYFSDYSEAVVIPASVLYNGKIYSVTSIGEHAFHSCRDLTSVTIPASVTTIGDNASPWTSKEVACADEIYKILPRCREANGEARS